MLIFDIIICGNLNKVNKNKEKEKYEEENMFLYYVIFVFLLFRKPLLSKHSLTPPEYSGVTCKDQYEGKKSITYLDMITVTCIFDNLMDPDHDSYINMIYICMYIYTYISYGNRSMIL
jgi:hypothetical protein